MYKFKTGNISNKILNKIIHNIRNGKHIQTFNSNDINLQGKWKNKFSDIEIFFAPKEFENNWVVQGQSNKNNLQLFLNKNDTIKFLQYNLKAIEYVRRNLLLLIEHELTHLLHFRKYPKAFKDLNKNYSKGDGNDYREIEAVTNEAVKIKKDYNLSFLYTIKDVIKKRPTLNKKKFIKKFYKKIYGR